MNDPGYRVLMIDDDEVIAQSTAEYFNMFDVKTAYVTGFDEAIAFLEKHSVSLVLLDINLGERSGFELCKRIRRDYDMPVFFISARTGDDDVLIALNIGGDDYIKKPYTLSILLAKVKAALARYERARDAAAVIPESRTQPASSDAVIAVAENISLDTNLRCIIKDGSRIALKDMEYRLLHYLASNRGRVVTKDELLKNVWEDEYTGEGTIAVHIRHLREKTEEDPKDPRIIKTVWGVGYMMDEQIR